MKKYFKYILIAIICLIVIGCGIVIALVLKPKHSLDNESLDSKKEQYECVSILTNDENLVEKSFLEVSVSNNRVISEESYDYIVVKDDSIYQEMKNSDDYKDANFNDSDKSVKISKSSKDMTKTTDGKDLELNYEEYKEQLSKVGFTCTLKSS